MKEQNAQPATPEQRAEAAARDLADRGQRVTARAVREQAGVMMSVANAAARAWREATEEDTGLHVPEVPDDVRGRLSAIWADAYRAAHATVTPERDQLAATASELQAEVDALTATVEEVEAERDAHAADVTAAQKAADEAASRAEAAKREALELEARATAAEARADAAEGERDRLAAQVAALIERIPSASKTEA
jgi:hypothetical protein